MTDDVRLRRLVRLAEELAEHGLDVGTAGPSPALLLEEVDLALRPHRHERRVASSGTFLEPGVDRAVWATAAGLEATGKVLDEAALAGARRFTDGLSSWLLRRADGPPEWVVFDRPAGSERDLVVLAAASGAVIVQRHPNGQVRVVGPFGVLRWEGLDWHHEPPVQAWLDTVAAGPDHGDGAVLRALLEFAVHDLGARGIGALLVHRPGTEAGPIVEERLDPPPPLQVVRPTHLAPLRHALAQVDGAAVFDATGALRALGVRLVPSRSSEATVDPMGGTRHTSGRRYSRDDPTATVLVVSEDGPVTVLRDGEVLGRSPADG